jgi:hypothetical protein
MNIIVTALGLGLILGNGLIQGNGVLQLQQGASAKARSQTQRGRPNTQKLQAQQLRGKIAEEQAGCSGLAR